MHRFQEVEQIVDEVRCIGCGVPSRFRTGGDTLGMPDALVIHFNRVMEGARAVETPLGYPERFDSGGLFPYVEQKPFDLCSVLFRSGGASRNRAAGSVALRQGMRCADQFRRCAAARAYALRYERTHSAESAEGVNDRARWPINRSFGFLASASVRPRTFNSIACGRSVPFVFRCKLRTRKRIWTPFRRMGEFACKVRMPRGAPRAVSGLTSSTTLTTLFDKLSYLGVNKEVHVIMLPGRNGSPLPINLDPPQRTLASYNADGHTEIHVTERFPNGAAVLGGRANLVW